MGEIERYVDIRLERTVFVTKAAQKAYEGFLIPVTIGNLLVSKTAALHWSVDQAVAGWDSDHPPDGLEFQIIDELRQLLAEMEIDHENDGQQSLAATLSRAWATFLDDIV
ncbi:hypothetical protein PHISP_05428 [Aspergillus sp. HF37]|nr:hypothetical protein PHISP_05428 [Aspergillus sp. HF37]